MKTTDKPKMQKYTVKDFYKQFPNDDVCLEWLKNTLYPNGIFCDTCQRITKHHKVASRRSYSCDHCGHHVHPTADTIYHKSTTPLTDWFYATYLMASTRCGISAKQLERELGVTYKTAWRMFKMIRSMLDESDKKLGNEVEVDETYIGGRHKGKTGRGSENKTVVVGALNEKARLLLKFHRTSKPKRSFRLFKKPSNLIQWFTPTNCGLITLSKITVTVTKGFATRRKPTLSVTLIQTQ